MIFASSDSLASVGAVVELKSSLAALSYRSFAVVSCSCISRRVKSPRVSVLTLFLGGSSSVDGRIVAEVDRFDGVFRVDGCSGGGDLASAEDLP